MKGDKKKSEVSTVLKWFCSEGCTLASPMDMLNGLIQELNRDGFEIRRSHIFIRTIHPQITVEAYRWYRESHVTAHVLRKYQYESLCQKYPGGQVIRDLMSHGVLESEGFLNSPVCRVAMTGEEFRKRIRPGDEGSDFPIFKQLIADGVTDYLVLPMSFSLGVFNAIFWDTDKADGFARSEINVLRALMPMLTKYFEAHLERQTGRVLLAAYLGQRTSQKVLEGRIKRGDSEEIEAAIWFSDLRVFSNLSNSYEAPEIIEWLNKYFEIGADAVEANKGEVLKFVGDAVLAIFPISKGSSRETVCEAVLQSVSLTHDAMARWNRARVQEQRPELRHGVGLNIGLIQYGNIGASRRLDFTAIGSAVNLASRIEGMCASLGRQTLVSEEFASFCACDLDFAGEHTIKGFAEPQKIYTVANSHS
ncbi:MAG: adenylate/guanylate cyclase domain-containing protein [bacterium]|nr:adenylate/guanylate cyclase domain-containing protein [bacterium]